VAPCGLSSFFLELPLFMGRIALIFQNRFSISALFGNFAAIVANAGDLACLQCVAGKGARAPTVN